MNWWRTRSTRHHVTKNWAFVVPEIAKEDIHKTSTKTKQNKNPGIPTKQRAPPWHHKTFQSLRKTISATLVLSFQGRANSVQTWHDCGEPPTRHSFYSSGDEGGGVGGGGPEGWVSGLAGKWWGVDSAHGGIPLVVVRSVIWVWFVIKGVLSL